MSRHEKETLPLQSLKGIATSSLTTLGVGGKCDCYIEVRRLTEIERAFTRAAQSRNRVLTIGEGSNLLFSDTGFAGLIVRNRILGKEREDSEVEVGGGENLSKVIEWLNQMGLSGMERMYGIPGTVAGALVGNAGAYGQEIGERVVQVDAWKDGELRSFDRKGLQLEYRHSFFKSDPGWYVVRCRFRLVESGEDLQAVSNEILKRRFVKYPEGLKCPGSFFKNVKAKEIGADALSRVPRDFIIGDKIPAGKLLEAVGACGVRRGDAQFAGYHGNLIINRGNARSSDILSLANEFAGRVSDHFRIRLEPEILIVDDSGWPNLRPARAEV
jgi:UDP-N-acetylmuramate dehydrogenase